MKSLACACLAVLGAATDPAPSVSEAVEQYGLRIEPRKMPIEMLVVTHIERTPTEN
jgi:uncharacterized protein (TIGR03435 family)